ncbi:MAG: monofunctional biosynthetic peptidoglycan transglycosylase [Xanthomonadaceae bacterium]|nr:monofunctional biosynthetic peptidoglycan transglycosylase [Xanthomonadaceae bacterium]
MRILIVALITLATLMTSCTNKPVPPQNPEQLKNHYPVVHYQGPNKPFTVTLERRLPENWTFLTEIPKEVVRAVLISEDWSFYSHEGFDFGQIKEAVETNIERGKFARGASTITQQVAKNVFLDQNKSLIRKLREANLTVQLEEHLSKNRILEMYLNIAEWGEGIFGIEQAARFYFKKSPKNLNVKEGVFLAVLLPGPKKYSQSFRERELTDFIRKRINTILGKLHSAKVLTDEELDQWKNTKLSFEK